MLRTAYSNYRFIIFSLVLSLSACSDNKNEPINLMPTIQTLNHDGINREYLIQIPDTYDSTMASPILFNFHGFGGDINQYQNTANMYSIANAENLILVYPQGTLLDGLSHWNAALLGGDNKSSADDFGFIRALIRKITSQYNIDSNRVYATGFSNGAMFSYALACYHSDLFAAIASVSGTMLDTNCAPTHPLAVLSIHGTNDSVIPYNGNNLYNSVANVLQYWNQFNGTNTTPVINTENSNATTIEHHQYLNGISDVSVEHYKIINGEHRWFDVNYQGKNTGELIWTFLSRYDKNGLR